MRQPVNGHLILAVLADLSVNDRKDVLVEIKAELFRVERVASSNRCASRYVNWWLEEAHGVEREMGGLHHLQHKTLGFSGQRPGRELIAPHSLMPICKPSTN